MLHIKLKGIRNAATWYQLFCPQILIHPLTLGKGPKGQISTFSEHGHVVYQIKGNRVCSNMVANILPASPLPVPLTLVRSIGPNSTFSEHGYFVYQIKGNRECINMVANICPQPPPPPPPTLPAHPSPLGWGQQVKTQLFHNIVMLHIKLKGNLIGSKVKIQLIRNYQIIMKFAYPLTAIQLKRITNATTW